MLSVLSFIFECIVKVIEMLFSINIGDGLNLGLFMCIIFIFLPIMIAVVNFIKHIAISDMVSDYKYERSKERRQERKRGH